MFLINYEGIWVAFKLALKISFKIFPTKSLTILYIYILLLFACSDGAQQDSIWTNMWPCYHFVDLSGVWSCWELRAPYLHYFLTCTAVASRFLFIWKNGDLEIYIIWSTVCTNRISDANFHLFANQRFWKGNVSVLLITLKYILFMR